MFLEAGDFHWKVSQSVCRWLDPRSLPISTVVTFYSAQCSLEDQRAL